MNKYLIAGLITTCFIVFALNAVGQRVTLQSLLDESVSLSRNGKTAELAESLKSGSIALLSEANTRGNEMKDKLLGQAEMLKSLIPLAAKGSLKTDVLIKVVGSIKLVVGANSINNLLSEGKEGLLGNAKSLTGSLDMIQSGMAALDAKQQTKLSDLIATAAENVKKLDGQDAIAKGAASAAKRSLSKIVDLVKESV